MREDRTLCNFASPPNDSIPLSMFLIMHGCSTFTISWLGTLYHGACCDDFKFIELSPRFSAIGGAERPVILSSVDIALLH